MSLNCRRLICVRRVRGIRRRESRVFLAQLPYAGPTCQATSPCSLTLRAAMASACQSPAIRGEREKGEATVVKNITVPIICYYLITEF
jgi:hypothetical protein